MGQVDVTQCIRTQQHVLTIDQTCQAMQQRHVVRTYLPQPKDLQVALSCPFS